MIRQEIETAVGQALLRLGSQGQAPFVVERPADLAHGDYSTNAALIAAKTLKKSPPEIAQGLVESLEGTIEGVQKIEAVGGFVNFLLSNECVLEVVQEATHKTWGNNDLYVGKKIMVEYTDPNPFKEFHIGHLMSNAIGESIARLLEAGGAKVIRANYQGDVGPHVAKAIWGKMQSPDAEWGAAYVLGAAAYEEHKEEIDAINKKVYEKSDSEVSTLYDAGRKESLERFEGIYKTLGTTFDQYFFESVTGVRGLEIVQKHPEVFEKSEGATVFHGSHTRVFVNSQGLPTYEAKDLGLAEIKKETADFDTSITITASEQSDYFKVILEALARIHPEWEGQFKHISHGMMRFAKEKMSSRLGNVITGESLLAELTVAARGREDVAVAAVKYTVLKSGTGRDIVFDPEKSLSLEGDSGPYVQYALVRSRSLLRKAAQATVEKASPEADLPAFAAAQSLARVLVHFPDAVSRAGRELEPHYVTTYITELASAFNSWYAQGKVLNDEQISDYHLDLVKGVENTLARGLSILGIPTPEEM